MMLFEDQRFDAVTDFDSGRAISDIDFRHCYFEGCSLSVTERPELRTTVRNVRLVQCSQRGCAIDTAILEDVVVDGLATHGQLLQTWGAVFKHVVFKGKVDRVMLSPAISAGLASADVQAAFDEANAAYYRGVDWALDISQGSFKEFEIRGIPAKFVRRDPETQVVVTRERAQQGEWRKLAFREELTPFSIGMMLRQGVADDILVAGKRHPKFKNYLADFELLRKEGIAQPD